MTQTFNYSKVSITIMLFIAAAFASCNESASPVTTNQEQVKNDSVKVFIVKTDSAQKTISLPGDLLPNQIVQVRAKVQGYISSVKADIGTKVHKGQILALIDAPEINTRVQELSAKEKAAQSRYQSSKDYYDRISTASKSDGVIALSELEKTKNQMLADESEYNAAKFAVSSNRQIGNYLAIIAPYTGTITKRNINIGSFVGAAGEKPLFEIEEDKLLRLQVAVPEIYTNAAIAGNAGELTTRSLPDKKFIAKLVRKSGIIDNTSRSELWEFEITNPSGELKAGSYADVKLHFLRTKQSLVIPLSAVVSTLEKRFVIRLSNNKTEWIDVRSGFSMNDKQEVFGEINPGDTLILKANEEIKPGNKVIASFSK